jgi:hypothetical protein
MTGFLAVPLRPRQTDRLLCASYENLPQVFGLDRLQIFCHEVKNGKSCLDFNDFSITRDRLNVQVLDLWGSWVYGVQGKALQQSCIGQRRQIGFRAVHTVAPKSISA